MRSVKPFQATMILCLLSIVASAQEKPPPPAHKKLPETHEYQKTLRSYLASLKEKDFDHGIKEKFTVPPPGDDVEEQYRHWLLSRLIQPLIGTKRGMPAVNAPSKLFTLPYIETPQGVMRTPLWPEPVAFLVTWNHPANPYHQSRAMKLRAFVTMCVQLAMNDDVLDQTPEIGGNKADWLAANVLMLAHPYSAMRDVVPEPVQKAYEVGLRKMGRRLLDWGLKGEEPNLDMISPVALWYVSQALNDAAFTKEVDTLAKTLFTDERHFHPAGYFVDRGGIDLGYAGQTHFFGTWAALTGRWPFAKEALVRCYRLRAHLCLPDPDGQYFGPSHFQTRYSADAWRDQWEWGDFRDTAASLITDEAAYLTKLPPPTELKDAIPRQARNLQSQINENPVRADRKGFLQNDEITNYPWSFRRWQTYNFPGTVNYAYEFYPKGAYAHRLELEKKKSPLLLSPFLREGDFLHDFNRTFTVAKQPGYSAILHTGSVGGPEVGDGFTILAGPYGFGGGQLSAFWTPTTGSVLLGRRGGTTRDKNFDQLEDWRLWPIHAVSGSRPSGAVFTTARIRSPEVINEQGTVRVQGIIPRTQLGQARVLEGTCHYSRTFKMDKAALQIETTLKTTGQDSFAELYETLPVFLRETAKQPMAIPTTIEFRVGEKWTTAGVDWSEGVTAIRLKRFTGAVVINIDRARRVKLSPKEWADTYLSKATCRNVMIDLLENKDQPKVLRETSVRYTIQPESK